MYESIGDAWQAIDFHLDFVAQAPGRNVWVTVVRAENDADHEGERHTHSHHLRELCASSIGLIDFISLLSHIILGPHRS